MAGITINFFSLAKRSKQYLERLTDFKMKKILFTIFFVFVTNLLTQAQTYVYDGQGNMIAGSHIKSKPGSILTLKDSLTGNTFWLDANHINIYAINSIGDTLWKADPYKDSKIEAYRVSRPVIVNFELITSHWCYKGEKKTIWINYNNTQAGYVDLDSGTFHFCGQD